MHAELRIESIASLLEKIPRRELYPAKFPRGRVRDDSWDAAFLSRVMQDGVFGCIMLMIDPKPGSGISRGLAVIDGSQRINALTRLVSGVDFFTGASIGSVYYDLVNDSFRPIQGPYCVSFGNFMKDIMIDNFELDDDLRFGMKLSNENIRIALFNIDKLRRFMHVQVPCYIFKDNKDITLIFETVNNQGEPLSPEDLASNSSFPCSGGYRDANNKVDIDAACPALSEENVSIIETEFRSLFGFKDIPVVVMTVPSEIINALALDPLELISFYHELLKIYRKEYSNVFEALRVRCDKEALPVLNGINEEEIFFGKRYREIQSALWLLYDSVSSFLPTGFKMITLKYNGVFLSENCTLGSTTYTPGCYVSEDRYDDELEETNRHETAHAYFYYHKKKFFQCKWIEEGLAEVAGKNTPVTTYYLKATASNNRYYNFLVYFQTLPVKRMQLIVRHWIKGDVKPSYWSKLVKEYKKLI